MSVPSSARELISLVSDRGAPFKPWFTNLTSSDPLAFADTKAYASRLAEAGEQTGESESVVVGMTKVAGYRVVVIVSDFGFLAGTMGIASAKRVVQALDQARHDRVPVLAMPCSGGTRMQEGTIAFVQMAPVAAAVSRLRRSGIPYITYLRNPTMGGVLASWGALGQVTFAEPNALIGLTGPRVVEQLTGEPFDAGIQRAERLVQVGLVDDVVAPQDLPTRVGRVLAVTNSDTHQDPPHRSGMELPEGAEVDAWEAVSRSRLPRRPGMPDLLALCDDVTTLRGDGGGDDDAGCIAALARIRGLGAMMVGSDRPSDGRGASLGASAYRKIHRAMVLAEELRLPLVTVIDTAGARMSKEDEHGGLAAAIARCLADLSSLDVPTISVLLGEGCGGGAIPLLPCDRVIAVENSWLAPIAPEGGSSILFRTTSRAGELARNQAISSTSLRRDGIADVVLSESASGAQGFAGIVLDRVAYELCSLLPEPAALRLRAREARWRAVGDQAVRCLDRELRPTHRIS